ncbi:hypothetical protein OH540_21235 [Streptomyces sp. BPPL-273]|uniref:hypothetical protein n=1 Tax=Streptomyces sp. BPPL-273 TaxID=2987533 RepID=UPI0024AF83B8|nr:hypothetical protein [Streptomyces sp. BPPL-273]WHM32429.1 hypothetical protein OH540_21235 [Streptomyces sp. BPPL-273]
MSLFSRKSDVDTSPGTNPRTGQPCRTDREFWTSLATDADRRAAAANSKEGRKAMEKNAADFRRNANGKKR